MRSTGVFAFVAVVVLSCRSAGLAAVQDLGSFRQYEKVELSFPYLSQPPFLDVPLDHWAFDGIEACAAAGVVTGYPGGSYQPANPIDRAQMAVFIARIVAGGDAHIPTAPSVASFPDVPTDYWAYKYVEYGKQLGLLQGYSDGRYYPDRQLDRAQAAVFVARAMRTPTGTPLADYTPPATPTFADVDPGFWAYKYIEFLAARGVVHGYPDGLYYPADTYTRDQLAVFISQAFDLIAPLGGNGSNPFDPAVIDVEAEFTTPSGNAITVPGFYCRPYVRSLVEATGRGKEMLSPSGPPAFLVRFAWNEIGNYSFRVRVQDVRGEREVTSGTFAVTASGDNGYIRPSRMAPNFFQFDSGRSYYAIGGNMGWPEWAGTYDYDLWMPDLAAHGGNYLRLFLGDPEEQNTLEHLSAQPGDGLGLGRYDQRAAWRFDYILDRACDLGLAVLLSIDGWSLSTGESWPGWYSSPYNWANGGPCHLQPEFFVNPEAQRLFQQKLRYAVARWGYQTSLLGWELYSEVDAVGRFDPEATADWHRTMGDYLRAIDPWRHPVTTSFTQAIIAAACQDYPAMEAGPALDMLQNHNYNAHDIATTLSQLQRTYNTYGKPHFFGEFGVGWDGLELADEPDQRLPLHEALWSALVSPAAGTPAPWCWGDWPRASDFYWQLAPVAAFANDIDWVKENYQPAAVADLRYLPGHEPSGPATLAVEPPGYSCAGGSPLNLPGSFTIDNDGTVSNSPLLSWDRYESNAATFEVNYPVPGRFEMLVWATVAMQNDAGLRVSLDGVEALTASFPMPAAEWDGLSFAYDGLYGIDVPAGPHTVLVENPSAGTYYASYRLTNYLTSPNLLVLAVSNPTSALAWVRNRQYTWWNVYNDFAAEPAGACEFALTGFEPGTYVIEQWDTYEGAIVSASTFDCTDGSVTITTPEGLATDVAYKVRRAP